MQKNPKSHDTLFKWLLTSFTREFFDHYFPDIQLGAYRFIDKEFISKYEALKESLRGDLFLVMEVEVNGQWQDVVIQIEHQSKRKDVSERVFEYACYAWLLKRKPVWSIVIFTDDAMWRKPVSEQFYYAYHSQHQQQWYHFDVIKVNREKSQDLLAKQTMLCKLLALKANDKDMESAQIVREIYAAAENLRGQLTNEQLLLIEQWVSFYKKVSEQRFEEIKKEVKMSFIATTITEHIQHEAKELGKIEGKIEGKILGKIENLETLFHEKIISQEEFEKRVKPLREKWKQLLSQEVEQITTSTSATKQSKQKKSTRRSKKQQKEAA